MVEVIAKDCFDQQWVMEMPSTLLAFESGYSDNWVTGSGFSDSMFFLRSLETGFSTALLAKRKMNKVKPLSLPESDCCWLKCYYSVKDLPHREVLSFE